MINGQNNILLNNGKEIPFPNDWIIDGECNKISLALEGDFNEKIKNVKIIIWGSNNEIIFGKNSNGKISLLIGDYYTYRETAKTHHCKFECGENNIFGGVDVCLCEPNSYVKIGNDCMFSWDIHLWCSDCHTILDSNKKVVLNWGKSIELGEHIWVGLGAKILKNTKISNNSVIGMGSVVVGKEFLEQNVVIAGNPAKVVKRNINWDEKSPTEFV